VEVRSQPARPYGSAASASNPVLGNETRFPEGGCDATLPRSHAATRYGHQPVAWRIPIPIGPDKFTVERCFLAVRLGHGTETPRASSQSSRRTQRIRQPRETSTETRTSWDRSRHRDGCICKDRWTAMPAGRSKLRRRVCRFFWGIRTALRQRKSPKSLEEATLTKRKDRAVQTTSSTLPPGYANERPAE
jgi:hypothetical protein